MDTPLVIFALIAVVAMGMMVFADSTMTGQGISIDRLDPEMAKKVKKAMEKEQYTPPSNTKTICDCPDLYGDRIVTMKQNSLYAGISWFDCEIVKEIITLRQKLKMDISQWHLISNVCKAHGW